MDVLMFSMQWIAIIAIHTTYSPVYVEAILKNNDRYKYTCAAPIRVTMLRCRLIHQQVLLEARGSRGRLTSYPPVFVL
jgi:hypothetical protein